MSEITDGGKLHADHWSTEQQAALLQTSERKREAYLRVATALRDGPREYDSRRPGWWNGARGCTDDELRRHLALQTGTRQSKSGPATRRGELVEMGLVRPQRKDTEVDGYGEIVKRPSDLGGPMIVWELVPADEYVKPAPKSKGPKLDHAGVAAARRKLEWVAGDSNLADEAIDAYLNPAKVMRELDDIGAP